MKPLVSVLMSVHNEPEAYLECAIGSICAQTYTNLELVIIDDASGTSTSDYLEKLRKRHSIISIYRNKQNLGLTSSLNRGLKLCKGEYIARMDADDYSLPERIQRQVSFLQAHPDADIIGTGTVSFGEKVSFMSPTSGYSVAQAQAQLFFTSTLCHPSVMIRKEFLNRTGLKYDENVKKGQDYDLWERASIEGRLMVMPDVLLLYRLHPRQITSTSRKDQFNTLQSTMRRRLQRLNIELTDRDFLCHLALGGTPADVSISEIEDWVTKVSDAAINLGWIDTGELKRNLRERLLTAKLERKHLPTLNEIPLLFKMIKYRIGMALKVNHYRSKIKKLGL